MHTRLSQIKFYCCRLSYLSSHDVARWLCSVRWRPQQALMLVEGRRLQDQRVRGLIGQVMEVRRSCSEAVLHVLQRR
jgi:hypothetical protein